MACKHLREETRKCFAAGAAPLHMTRRVVCVSDFVDERRERVSTATATASPSPSPLRRRAERCRCSSTVSAAAAATAAPRGLDCEEAVKPHLEALMQRLYDGVPLPRRRFEREATEKLNRSNALLHCRSLGDDHASGFRGRRRLCRDRCRCHHIGLALRRQPTRASTSAA